jgi:glutaryl-CoA dehydrogenase (non-decarboxylating)
MLAHLSPDQAARREVFQDFAGRFIAPHAARADSEQAVPGAVIDALAGQGYIGTTLPKEHGGRGMGMVDYGVLTEELGWACQSVRNLVAVQDMVACTLQRWGSPQQRERWLPRIISGQTLAAFALTEPDVGTDAAAIATTATADAGTVVLSGTKKWISFAQNAGVYLVFAKLAGAHTAFLVERDTPGLSVEPIGGLLGLRGSMLAQITLDGSRVPAENMVGRPGFGLNLVASGALDLGRYSTAWGAVGLARACLEAAVAYACQRAQFGTEIRNHQLVQQLLADMATGTLAARLMCHHAGVSKEQGEPHAPQLTLMAKYQASTTAVRVSADAVQIHGAQGVGQESPVQRCYRDAKVLEIIEGTTQIQQSLIGQFAAQVGRR